MRLRLPNSLRPANRRPDVRRVHPAAQRVVKLMPTGPPSKGDDVLVDGVRHTVVKADVTWAGNHWHLDALWVKEWAA